MGNGPPSRPSGAGATPLPDGEQLFELRRLKAVPSGPGSFTRDRAEGPDVWTTLRDKRRTLALSVLLSVLLVLAFTLTSKMTFRTAGSLYLGEVQEKGPARASGETADFLASPQGELGTEIEILKSETLVGKAILESGLNVSVAPAGTSAPRYWKWRLSQRDPNLIDDRGLDELVVSGELAGNAQQPQSYTVKFISANDYELWSRPLPLVPGALGEKLAPLHPRLSGGAPARVAKGKLGERLSTTEVRLTLAPGQRAPRAGAEYALTVRSLDDTLQSVLEALSVLSPKSAAPGGSISIVRLEFSHESPRRAQRFLEKLMHGYLNQRQLWKTEEASAAETFVTEQLKSMRESLDRAEQRLADYKESSGVVMLSDEAKAMIDQLATFEQQRVAVGLQVSSFKDVERMLQKSDAAPVEAYLLGETQDTVLAGLGASLTKAQEELKKREQEFTADAPAVREQRAQVEAQREMVQNYVKSRSERAREQLGALGGMIAQYENKLKTMPRAEVELAQLGRHTEVLSKTYSYLLERQQQAAIVKAASISDNRILDLPKVPHFEDSPRLGQRVLVGALAGLCLGVLFVLGRKRFAGVFQSAADVMQRFQALAVFGLLPHLARRERAKPSGRKPVRLLECVSGETSASFARACASLRGNIYRAGPRAPCKVIAVTSATPRDGKTSAALALASALSADNSRVLLIDADMHAPAHHALLGVPQEPGLSNVFQGELSWRDAIHAIHVPHGAFEALTAGERSSAGAEWFSSLLAETLFGDLRRQFDVIVIDAPSFPLLPDALLLSTYADLVLTVVRPGNTRRDATDEHVQRLSALVPCALVINDVDVATCERHGYAAGAKMGARGSSSTGRFRSPQRVSSTGAE